MERDRGVEVRRVEGKGFEARYSSSRCVYAHKKANMVSQTSFTLQIVVCLLCGSTLHASSLREGKQMSRQLESSPTMVPVGAPSIQPAMVPFGSPTGAPNVAMTPSDAPTVPTTAPGAPLTDAPSSDSTTAPSDAPSMVPSGAPSTEPSEVQITALSGAPITAPSGAPSRQTCKILGFEIVGRTTTGSLFRLALEDGNVLCIKDIPKPFKIKVITDACVTKVRMHRINGNDVILRKTDSKAPFTIAGQRAPMEFEIFATPDGNRSLRKHISFTLRRGPCVVEVA